MELEAPSTLYAASSGVLAPRLPNKNELSYKFMGHDSLTKTQFGLDIHHEGGKGTTSSLLNFLCCFMTNKSRSGHVLQVLEDSF
jgi:hypothetical protein